MKAKFGKKNPLAKIIYGYLEDLKNGYSLEQTVERILQLFERSNHGTD